MANDILTRAGERLRKLRKQRGWSLQKLSDQTGFHPTTLSQVESGKRNLTLKNVKRLADGLNIKPHQLFLFTDRKHTKLDQPDQLSSTDLIDELSVDKKELMYNLGEIVMNWNPE